MDRLVLIVSTEAKPTAAASVVSVAKSGLIFAGDIELLLVVVAVVVVVRRRTAIAAAVAVAGGDGGAAAICGFHPREKPVFHTSAVFSRYNSCHALALVTYSADGHPKFKWLLMAAVVMVPKISANFSSWRHPRPLRPGPSADRVR